MRVAIALLGGIALAGGGAGAASGGAEHAIVIALGDGTPGVAIRVASFGLAELTPRELGAMPVLHVRMSITNLASPAPWAFDVTSARLAAGDRSERALFASSDVATLPVVVIDRGERAVVDLYFAAPATGPGGTGDVTGDTAFEVAWRIATAGRTVARTTRVVFEDETSLANLLDPVGRGGHWWCNPCYPWPLFHHRDGAIARRAPVEVMVTGPPRWRRR